MIDRSIPLVDLHRHLDGSVRLETILELGLKYRIPLPAWDLDALRPHVQVTEPQAGVMAFIARFRWMTAVLADLDACRRIARESVEDAAAEGIDHVELRFSPWFMAETHGLDPTGVTEAVLEGVAEGAAATGISTGVIGILSRTYGPDLCRQELEALLPFRDRIVALDLAGDEARFPARLFAGHFRRARDVGWNITVHAGEADGAGSIWASLRELGATRIGHAVRAIDDPALMDHLAEAQVGIETNLTSNVQTSTVRDYAHHPLRLFLERGMLATINTDDPGISGVNLAHEYTVAAPAAGLTRDQILRAQKNALEIAFLGPAAKDGIRRKVAARARAAPAPETRQ